MGEPDLATHPRPQDFAKRYPGNKGMVVLRERSSPKKCRGAACESPRVTPIRLQTGAERNLVASIRSFRFHEAGRRARSAAACTERGSSEERRATMRLRYATTDGVNQALATRVGAACGAVVCRCRRQKYRRTACSTQCSVTPTWVNVIE